MDEGWLSKAEDKGQCPDFFLCIPASAVDVAAVNPRGLTLLANGLITFFINGNPVFSNEPSNLQEILLIVSS